MHRVVVSAVAVVLMSGGGAAWAGPDWVEQGDAGSIPGRAQRTIGTGDLRSISGTLSEGLSVPDYEDLYFIQILNPTGFRFDLTRASFDTQVFIFELRPDSNEFAYGLLGNDDGIVQGKPVMGSLIDGPANDGSGARITKPGIYLLAITGYGRIPMSYTGPIYSFASRTEISGPDGQGGLDPLEAWEGRGAVGRYRIELEGVGFSHVPGPGAACPLVLWGVLASRRRRA
jgi:hypothetical protein